jgi:hypothetical protein
MVYNAGTIERRHSLDVMKLTTSSHLRPFLYEVHGQDALNFDDYGRSIPGIVQEPKTKKFRVRSMVRDNLRA